MQDVRGADQAWETPWERAIPPEKVKQYERDQFEASVQHLRSFMLRET